MFDVSKLTLGEIGKVESLANVSIDSIGSDGAPKGLLLAALVFVKQKRENPTYTWNEACELDMATALETLGFNDEPEPEPEGEAPDFTGND
ncbi:hypothetical protein SAMN06309944_0167 [Micrococcales bacterium KH10]|nr:hypothetical protein SAMN06309944_0167 [Micrococcales bacterium KH10]